ncbi:MAG: ferritin-like domain-containing protein [Nitrospirota bacterium]
MKIKSLQDLYGEQLKDLYSAEQQVSKELPKMLKKASSNDLKNMLQQHLNNSKNQAERLESILEEVNMKPSRSKCVGMEGIIEESNEVLSELEDSEAMDAGIIALLQRIEHYEIAAYGTARTYAHMLGHHDAAKILQEILHEKKEEDKHLTSLAESGINEAAAKAA